MGKVIFVSAGPGAADLITVRGARALEAAQVVLFDALTDPALRELAPTAQWIDVGKRGFCDSTKQCAINAALVKQAQTHERVVRLKGGDASVFGRLEEELIALAEAGIACEVVPGVTAAIAAAAQTRKPLTRRGVGRSVSLTTAVTQDLELQAGTRSADTEVFYMAGRQLAALGRKLLEAGWAGETPVSVVSRAGCEDALSSEHSVAQLAAASLLHKGRPTVVVVGAGARPVLSQNHERPTNSSITPGLARHQARNPSLTD
ncbi:uroporphyrin-III C-methyltransferase [Paucibacter oligotrophus]|uniref:uroporphyrinogen-III C-methyltransferase n=1 Tax=Roseateles oligotrophus TaxID=1769250 RepID=A0A840L7W3_9BURK|nr:uroporphyrinogen-III C-methyltransferase [Roseateles oligotrophus]MBB4842318.1 uroporphyrin-III C-methyltransferase [Roseateles oligotrophus]